MRMAWSKVIGVDVVQTGPIPDVFDGGLVGLRLAGDGSVPEVRESDASRVVLLDRSGCWDDNCC